MRIRVDQSERELDPDPERPFDPRLPRLELPPDRPDEDDPPLERLPELLVPRLELELEPLRPDALRSLPALDRERELLERS